jgi:hypothetical protein
MNQPQQTFHKGLGASIAIVLAAPIVLAAFAVNHSVYKTSNNPRTITLFAHI